MAGTQLVFLMRLKLSVRTILRLNKNESRIEGGICTGIPVPKNASSKSFSYFISIVYFYLQIPADIVCTETEYQSLCGLMRLAGIADLFSGGLFTIFAPSNDAFQAALQSLGQTVDMQDPRVITNILLQHVVWGSAVYSKDLVCDMTVPMSNGDDNTITCKDDDFFVGGPGNDVDAFPGIASADIDACNGVIHIIDGVLLPE